MRRNVETVSKSSASRAIAEAETLIVLRAPIHRDREMFKQLAHARAEYRNGNYAQAAREARLLLASLDRGA